MTSADEATRVAAENSANDVGAPKPRPAADRFMRALLRVTSVDRSSATESSAHRYFGASMVLTGIRCLITYLLIPIAVPILGLSGAVSAPLGIALALVAVASGIVSLRKFWLSDHRLRWVYTAFIGFVFLILAFTLYSDISEIVSHL